LGLTLCQKNCRFQVRWFKLFQSNLIHKNCHRQKDGQTDGRTDGWTTRDRPAWSRSCV